MVEAQRFAAQDVFGQIDGEPVGVVETEHDVPRQGVATLSAQGRHLVLEQREPLGQRFEKALFFALHALGDVVAARHQFGVGLAHLFDDRTRHAVQEGFFHAEQHAVARGAAQNAAQHVAAPFVRGQDAVGEQKRDRANVVGHDPQRHVALVALPEPDAGTLLGALENAREEIGVVVRTNALEHRGQSLETGAGVDTGRGQRRHRAGRIPVELHEDEIPDFEKAPGFRGRIVVVDTRDRAVVIVNLRTRPAGSRVAHRPEVLVLVEAEDLFFRQADLVPPQDVGFVIFAENARDQTIAGNPQGLGHELPGVDDGVFLEVVAEGEVSEHLEEGVVPRRAPTFSRSLCFPETRMHFCEVVARL